MKYLWFPVALCMCSALTQCEKAEQMTEKAASKGDMTFAKNTFEALARGDAEARNSIDWDTFQVMGQNVGAGYVQIPSETEKVNFQNAFVTQFASSFRAAGGTPEFANWRVSHHDDLKTEVAADSGGGTVTITVTERNGKERVSGIGFIR